MVNSGKVILLAVVLLSTNLWAKPNKIYQDLRIVSHVVDPLSSELRLYHKDKNGTIFKSFANLKKYLGEQNKTLEFAMNGGMYMEDSTPLGLYVQEHRIIKKINRVQKAYGNFYIQPNGIFFITKDKNAYIKPTKDFHYKKYVKYATQSGPMLVIDGKINSKLKKGSLYTHIRNGVGILPDGKVLFAISKGLINFYDFAEFFQKNGCKNALYLDGAVSQIYLPPDYKGGEYSQFGVIIAEVK